MAYSKVTKKGQITIPSRFRDRLDLREGTIVTFKEADKALVIEPVPDITESAGKLSKYAPASEIIRDLIRSRELNFR